MLILICGIAGVACMFGAVVLLNQRGSRTSTDKESGSATEQSLTPIAYAPPTLPELAAQPKGDEDYDPRAMTASTKLAAAKQYCAAKPEDVWGYHAKLDELVKDFGGTPAADEAKKLMAGIKLPPGPPPSAAPAQPPAAPVGENKKPDQPAKTAAAKPPEPKPEPAKAKPAQPAKPVQENILMEFDFTQGSTLGWKADKGLENFTFGKDGLASALNAADASMSLGNMNLNTSLVTHVSFRIKSDKAGDCKLGYTTSTSAKFEKNDLPSVKCAGDNQWHEYMVKLAGLKNYEGQLRSLRLDLISGGTGAKIEMRWIRLISRE
jgi:hypothetical protein